MLQITLNEPFIIGLDMNTSPAFMNLSNRVETELGNAFSNVLGFESITVDRIFNGSTVIW